MLADKLDRIWRCTAEMIAKGPFTYYDITFNKVGHWWRKKPRLAYFVDVCPCINVPCIVFWNIANRKLESNFPYEIKICRGGQNRALGISWTSLHAIRPLHALSSISIFFNIIWSHWCVRISIICMRPYLSYNFLFHKDVCINVVVKSSSIEQIRVLYFRISSTFEQQLLERALSKYRYSRFH